MANLWIRIKGLSKKSGSKVLFNEAEALVRENDRIGLIGKNGSGKSTLIRCILGEESFNGTIEIDPNIKISAMEQEGELKNMSDTFAEHIQKKYGGSSSRKKELEKKLADPDYYNDPDKYEKILEEYSTFLGSGFDLDSLNQGITEFLNYIKFGGNLKSKLKDLSGGQRTQLRLAECLSKKCDLIILDEPTNNLDYKVRARLEKYLLKLKKTMVLISHDRFFLDRLVTQIIEIENSKLVKFKGGYSKYLKEHEKHISELRSKHEKVEKERRRLEESAKQKKRWASISRSRDLKLKAKHLMDRAEKLPDIPNPELFRSKYRLLFKNVKKLLGRVVSVENLSLKYDDVVLYDDVNFFVGGGEKIALIGVNGAGKTTLLKILAMKIKAKGNIELRKDLRIGYFDQEFKELNMSKQVLEFMQSELLGMEDHRILAYLVATGFPREKFRYPVKVLSGGEKARLNLVRLMLSGYNILILDEPTNNLDLDLMESLEDALKKFSGTVIFSSHDRFLIEKVASKVLEIKNQKIEEISKEGLFDW